MSRVQRGQRVAYVRSCYEDSCECRCHEEADSDADLCNDCVQVFHEEDEEPPDFNDWYAEQPKRRR